MTKWKYLKGSEKDFDGGHAEATHKYLHKECKHPVYTAKPEIIKEVLFDLVALREPITDCTLKDGVVFDALIGMPLNGFRCRQQPIAYEDDLNECINSTEALIAERGNRYGKFKDGAEIMRDLKHVMHEVDGWNNLSPSQKEALDMIQHKIGRILNGDPAYDDNWKDIAGYSKLIADELNGEIK